MSKSLKEISYVLETSRSATDDAIALFSNKNAKDMILMQPYEEYVRLFNNGFVELLKIAPSVNSVDSIIDEEIQLEFIKAFRNLMRLLNILKGFSDFKWSDLSMSEQMFEDYKSKYLDLYEKIKNEKNEGKEKVSILEDVDFELELIHKDEINVAYILKLLVKYNETKEQDKQGFRDNIINILNSNPQLRSKRELIEKFIDENLASVDSDNIEEVFEKFWDEEKIKEFDKICQEENLIIDEVKNVVDTYLYDERKPLNDDIFKTLQIKPKLLERKPIVQRVLGKIMNFVEKFYDGYGGSSEVVVAPTNSLEYKPQLESMMVAETKQSYGENKI
jgi:type I restriction enzyme, R subunit